MILDPIRQRYGYGAGRLAIRRPANAPALAGAARIAVDRERVFAATPTVACATVAMALMLAIQFASFSPAQRDAPEFAERTPLEIEFLTEAVQERPTIDRPAAGTPSPPIARVEPGATVASDTGESETPDTSAFEVASVVMNGLSAPVPEGIQARTAPSARSVRQRPRPTSRPSSRHAAPRELLADGVVSAPIPIAFDAADPNAPVDSSGSHRPGARTIGDFSEGDLDWTRSNRNGDFIVAAANDRSRRPGSRVGDPTPAVSAARAALSSRADDTLRDELSRAWRGAGWQEVPLGTLPDCTPPGRQDMLKKRILLAAPFERECSHQDGSYRFVETRNLGAFLMWSRSNPDRLARPNGDVDVCDVLERALRCLDRSSIEESIAK